MHCHKVTCVNRSLYLVRLLAALCAGNALRAETFRNPYRIPTGSDPGSVMVADVNGDGLPDLLWGDKSSAPASVHVLFAQPSGGYLPGPVFKLPADVTPACRAFDTNNDTKPDLVCPYQNGLNGALATFLGNGDGTFGAPILTDFPSSSGYAYLTIFPPVDINSDAIPDLIVFNAGTTEYYVFLGDGNGGFKSIGPTAVSFLPLELAPVTMDVNGDGKPDLLIANGPNVELGNGDGTFQFPKAYGVYPFCVFHDMDGDGHPDAICGSAYDSDGNSIGGTQLLIYHGNSDGSFNSDPIVSITYGDPSNQFNGYDTMLFPLAIADVNGDGIADILAYAGDSLTVILGKPNLTFAYPTHFAAGYLSAQDVGYTNLVSAQYSDLDGDGLPDLVLSGPNGIYISYGQKDGTFRTAPAYEMARLIGFETVADFNEDGRPDVVVSGESSLELSLGKGDGTFLPRTPIPPGSINFDTGSATSDNLIHGDFNGDHHQDIIAIALNSAGIYDSFLLSGKGNGTFSLPQLLPNDETNFPAYAVQAVADINNDGRDDLYSNGLGELLVSLSNGDGTFTHIVNNVPVDPTGSSYQPESQVVLADFNRDGKLDAVFGAYHYAYVLKGHGDGTFDSTGATLAIPAYGNLVNVGSQSVAAGDFDGDGNQDVVLLVNYSAPGDIYLIPATTAAFIFYGKGDGTFSPGALVAAFDRVYTGIYAADLNKDGLADIILKSGGSISGPYAVGIVHGLPDRTFGPEINYFAGSGLADISIVDLNRDGFPDLLFSNGDYNIRANSVTVLMNLGNTASVTGTIAASPEPSAAGQPFTLTASLVPSSPATLSGTVGFAIDGNPVGSAPLAANSASLPFTGNLPIGAHSLAATWSGNSTYSPVTLTGTHQITSIATTLTLASSLNPADYGAPVTFTATISASSGSPTGSVTFSDGNSTLGVASLSNGVATYATSTLSAGSHNLTASYAANGNFGASSASLTEVIDGLPTATSFTTLPNPSYAYQQITAEVQVSGSTGRIPTGTITYYDGSASVTTVPLNQGVARTAFSFIAAGSYTLTASYSGDTASAPSISAPIVQTVLINPTVTTVTSPANPAVAFRPITLVLALPISSGLPDWTSTPIRGGREQRWRHPCPLAHVPPTSPAPDQNPQTTT
jgi:hypothetical protein